MYSYCSFKHSCVDLSNLSFLCKFVERHGQSSKHFAIWISVAFGQRMSKLVVQSGLLNSSLTQVEHSVPRSPASLQDCSKLS